MGKAAFPITKMRNKRYNSHYSPALQVINKILNGMDVHTFSCLPNDSLACLSLLIFIVRWLLMFLLFIGPDKLLCL